MNHKVDVIKRYEHEIMNIKNKLNQLEKGRVYEISKAKMDGGGRIIGLIIQMSHGQVPVQ